MPLKLYFMKCSESKISQRIHPLRTAPDGCFWRDMLMEIYWWILKVVLFFLCTIWLVQYRKFQSADWNKVTYVSQTTVILHKIKILETKSELTESFSIYFLFEMCTNWSMIKKVGWLLNWGTIRNKAKRLYKEPCLYRE